MVNKYRQKFLDHAKQSATDAFKTTSKKSIQKTKEATVDLIGTKIADTVAKSHNDEITRISSTEYFRDSPK